MNIDLQLFYFFNNLVGHSNLFDTMVIFFADYFQYFVMITLFTALFFQVSQKSEKIYFFITLCTSAVIARIGIVSLIRFFYHRPRPFLTHTVNQLLTNSGWSFPSGHATTFFAMAIVVYMYNKKWGYIFYVCSLLITISRVIGGIHYPSDILAGLLLGTIVGYLINYFIQRHQTQYSQKTTTNITE